MAVQETNFLYSLTLSGFIASSVTCTMLLEASYSGRDAYKDWIMLSLASFYFIYGLVISFTLYGRKTDFLRRLSVDGGYGLFDRDDEDEADEDSPDKKKESNM